MIHQSIFYRLIVDSEYRIWRHLLFIVALIIITFNQVFISYQDVANQLGKTLYLLCIMSLVSYLITTYANYFLLIPNLLLKGHYMRYITILLSFVILLIFTSILLEYYLRTYLSLPHRITSYRNPLIIIDSLSSSMITIICFWSMSAVTLLRQWNSTNDHIITLEHQFLQSEVNKLKGQVSPVFLSKALQKASHLTSYDANRASAILLQVGHLLRYQLYDCDREKVFLKSEISFIINFLELHKMACNHHFEYEVVTKGDRYNSLISPLLLLVVIEAILLNEAVKELNVTVETIDKKIKFDAQFVNHNILTDEHTKEVLDKLNTLYPQAYTWCIEPGNVQLQLDVA